MPAAAHIIPDSYFVEMLREGTGNERLDLAWFPNMGTVDGQRGCWCVVWPIPFFRCANIKDQEVGWVEDKSWVVMALDGNHGNPRHPGSWVVEALNASDEKRHGRRALHQQMDDLREERVIAKQRLVDGMAAPMRSDDMFKAMRKYAEEFGVELCSDQELKKMEEDAAAVKAQSVEEDLQERKEARLNVYAD